MIARTPIPRRFTLLELLVVVGVLASVAGLALVFFFDVEERAGTDLGARELAELKRALLRFRQDIGYFFK